jgi:hypothetical protein
MTQLREQILAQLHHLLGALPGLALCARDRGELSNDQRPGMIILDGSEAIIGDPATLKTVRMVPAIFTLRPQIIFVAKERDTSANETVDGKAATIGPELTYWLELTQATIFNDPTLRQLVTPNGQISYLGHETDFQWGSSLLGAIQMNFAFLYPFYPQYN